LPAIVDRTGGGICTTTNRGDAREFAQALMAAWRNPDEATQWGSHGYRNVRERFTLEQMAERVEAVYGEAAGVSVPGRPHQPYPNDGVSVVKSAPSGA
jgi:glycosyltransferase involved in cell wall biosynthesis